MKDAGPKRDPGASDVWSQCPIIVYMRKPNSERPGGLPKAIQQGNRKARVQLTDSIRLLPQDTVHMAMEPWMRGGNPSLYPS